MTFDEASKEIAEGRAQAHALWMLLSTENQRDGLALKPALWEGPGEYQHVTRGDEKLGVLVYLPTHKALPIVKVQP